MALEYAELEPGLFGLGLHRGVLFDALYRAACAEPGVTVCTGVDVEDLAALRDGRVAVVEHGSRRRHGRHDLVVVGNGARSSLRDDTAFVKRVTPYPWGALWAVVPDHDGRFTGQLSQVVRGTRRLIGLLPTGQGPDGGPRQVSLFYSLRGDGLDAFRAGDFAAWAASVREDMPAAAPVLAQLRGPEDLLSSAYHDVAMWPWNTERVVYVGDAAHAMSPQLGQGCNLALLDAFVLAEALRDAETVADGLYRYSRLRRWHLAWYQLITRGLTPFFQSDLDWLRPLRDHGLRWATRLPWVRRQMVAGMAGTSRGPFLARLPLPGAR
jgi:2-polyprenyl-6-methoxyphenol hydroxylase-like FAD-dependent oxidoreductase